MRAAQLRAELSVKAHPRTMRRWTLSLPLLVFGARAGASALALRPLALVVPNEPGGGIDFVARTVAGALAALYSRPVPVLNRSGASGTIGTVSVARAEPDGQTLLITGVGHLIAPTLQAKPPYDPLRDFAAVARLAMTPNVLVAHSSLPALTLGELVKLPSAGRASIAYASAGYGHSSHLAMERLMQRTGLRALHVPYRGTGPAMQAVLAGDVQLILAPAVSAKAALATGKVRALGVAHEHRLAVLPEVPGFAEQGIRGAEFSQWYGVLAPRATPEPVLNALDEAFRSAMQDPAVVATLRQTGVEPAHLGRTAFEHFLAAESARILGLIDPGRIERPVQ